MFCGCDPCMCNDEDINIGYEGDNTDNQQDGSETNKDIKDAAKELADKLSEKSILKSPFGRIEEMKTIALINCNPFQLSFKADSETHEIRPGSFSLEFREQNAYETSSLGFQMMLAHEAYHIHQYTENPIYDSNYDYHSDMVNDPRYVDSLREMFPGHSEDFYNDLKWSGNQESQDYKNLPSEEKADLDDFFKDNGIPY